MLVLTSSKERAKYLFDLCTKDLKWVKPKNKCLYYMKKTPISIIKCLHFFWIIPFQRLWQKSKNISFVLWRKWNLLRKFSKIVVCIRMQYNVNLCSLKKAGIFGVFLPFPNFAHFSAIKRKCRSIIVKSGIFGVFVPFWLLTHGHNWLVLLRFVPLIAFQSKNQLAFCHWTHIPCDVVAPSWCLKNWGK